MWIDAHSRRITLYDRRDKALLEYDFTDITSIQRQDILEKTTTDTVLVMDTGRFGTHINTNRQTSVKRAEKQLIFATRDPQRPQITLFYFTKTAANRAANNVSQFLKMTSSI